MASGTASGKRYGVCFVLSETHAKVGAKEVTEADERALASLIIKLAASGCWLSSAHLLLFADIGNSVNTYLALFIISTCAAFLLTPLVRRLAERFGWLDVPRDERRVHLKAVPRLGGVAILPSVLLTLLALAFVENGVTRSLATNRAQLFAILVPATLVFLFGAYDDIRGAHARLKFLGQGLAATLLYFMGGRIEALSIPFVGSIELPWILGLTITVFWTVGITNAFNLIDGMDGLAAGAALFASVVILIVSLILGHPLVSVVALALSGSLIGFLRYNFNPASIFLGDSGSLFIGFTLAALSVQSTQKASTAVAVAIPLMAFGLPVVDTTLALIRRFLSGRALFEGDREHIHHMLLARGWSQRRVALVLYSVCALFGLMALLFVSAAGHATGLVLFIVGVAVVIAVGHLRYHEFDEIRDGMKRSLALPDRRLRTANNIRVRRASRTMSEAATLSELFSAVHELLELSEFAYVTVQLGGNGNPTHIERLMAREKDARSLRGSEVSDGMIFWSWERGDVEATEIIGSGRFWKLSLPLSEVRGGGWGCIDLYRECDSGALLLDINYGCTLFQREMAQAAARILNVSEMESAADQMFLSAVSSS